MAAGLVALVVTLLLTPLVKRLAEKYGAIDDPKRDERRIHKQPIPRWGGLAIYGGFLVSLLIAVPVAYSHNPFPAYLLGIMVIGGVLVALGSWDDVKPLSAKVQALYLLAAGFAIQLFHDGTGIAQIQGLSWPLFADAGKWVAFAPWVAYVVTAVYIFVVSKTMDTIDGVDGLAGGIGGIAAAVLSVIAVYEGQPRVALIAAAMGGACIGFLRYNYNPAKIFMATGGSQLLGFVLATLSVIGAMKTAATLALIIPIFVFGVPIIDAFVAVTRRIASGQPITQADKRHIHHTLLSRGLSQKQTVWILYGAALALAGILLWIVRNRG